jgi:AraC family transcriptional activator of pobA
MSSLTEKINMNHSKNKRKSEDFVKIHFLDKNGVEEESSDPRQKDFFEIIFFKNVDGLEPFVDFKPVSAQKGDVFIVQPGQVHYFKSMMGEQYEMVILSFSKSFKEDLSKDEIVAEFFDQLEYQSIVFNFDECRSKDLDFCLWQLEYEIVVKPQFWKPMIMHYIRLLITYLHRDGAEKGTIPQLNELLNLNYRFKKLVEGHFKQHLPIEEYAGMLNITEEHLMDTTYQAMQIQPEEYLQWRLNLEAKRLLFYNDHSLRDISASLGFIQVDDFSSFFLKHNNLSPMAFQKEMSQVVGGVA